MTSKRIDLSTQEGLDKLKAKAKDYGHYAEFLQVAELITEVENLRNKQTVAEKIYNAWKSYFYWDAVSKEDDEKKEDQFNEFTSLIAEEIVFEGEKQEDFPLPPLI